MATKTTDMTKFIKEVQAYERQREIDLKCNITTVEASNEIIVRDVLHAGVLSHICAAQDKHAGDCRCSCGYHWLGKSSRPI